MISEDASLQDAKMQEEGKESIDYPNQEFQNLSLNGQNTLDLSPEVKAKLKEEHDKFYACLNQMDFLGLKDVIKCLREWITSQTDPLPGKVVNDMEMLPHLLNLLSDEFSREQELQTEVAWLLANISAGTSQDTQVLVEKNIIAVMAHALRKNVNDNLHENAMWTLANIAGEDNLSYRDQILEEGVLKLIVKNLTLTPRKICYYRTAAWLIANLVRGEPFPPFEKVQVVFSALTHLIDYPDETILQHTLLGLAYLSEEAKEAHIKSISANSLIPKIVQAISSKKEKIAINAIKVAGNLAKSSKHLIHNLYDYEIFKALPKVLTSQNAELRRQACIMLSNLFSNEFDDHDYVDDYDGLDCLIKIVSHDEENDIRAQATLCLKKYLESASPEYVMIAIEKGVVEAFLQNLQASDPKLVENSLMGLYQALEYGETVKDKNEGYNFIVKTMMLNNLHKTIQGVLMHPNEDIVLKAEVLLAKYFQEYL